MATKKQTTTLIDFDLTEFKRQKQLVEQHASKAVAERVDQVKVLLKEIKELVEVSGIEIRLGGSYGSLAGLIEDVDQMHKDWNSSSYNC